MDRETFLEQMSAKTDTDEARQEAATYFYQRMSEHDNEDYSPILSPEELRRVSLEDWLTHIRCMS